MKVKNKDENKSMDLMIINPANISSEIRMELDKNDIVTYQVAKMEQALEKKEKGLVKDMNALQKKADALSKVADKLVEALEKKPSPYVAAINKVNAALTAIGAKKKDLYVIKCDGITTDKKIEKEVIGYTAKVEDHYGDGITLKSVPLPANIKAAQKKTDCVNEQITAILTDLSEVRTKLANVGKMERRAKATMTERILQNSKLGKTLLLAEPENE